MPTVQHNKVNSHTNDEIVIRPKSKKNSGFLILLGVCLLLVSLLLNSIFWNEYKFQLMLIMFACAIVLLVGLLKQSEPEISFRLFRQRLFFYHRNGQWDVSWHNILRIGDIKAYINGDLVTLPYIGIKLKHLENIADNITPRLANKLIHEQRELLILAVRNHQIVLESGLISFDHYVLNKKIYKGPIAAWLFRTEQLVNLYGYHLYIPETSFDRELNEFLKLLNNCKLHAN